MFYYKDIQIIAINASLGYKIILKGLNILFLVVEKQLHCADSILFTC